MTLTLTKALVSAALKRSYSGKAASTRSPQLSSARSSTATSSRAEFTPCGAGSAILRLEQQPKVYTDSSARAVGRKKSTRDRNATMCALRVYLTMGGNTPDGIGSYARCQTSIKRKTHLLPRLLSPCPAYSTQRPSSRLSISHPLSYSVVPPKLYTNIEPPPSSLNPTSPSCPSHKQRSPAAILYSTSHLTQVGRKRMDSISHERYPSPVRPRSVLLPTVRTRDPLQPRAVLRVGKTSALTLREP